MKLLLWVDKQIEWVKGFFQEPDGKPSNKRLLGSVVILIFLVTYSKHTLISGKFEDIPMNWAMLIFGILGLAVWLKKNGKQENGNAGHSQSSPSQ